MIDGHQCLATEAPPDASYKLSAARNGGVAHRAVEVRGRLVGALDTFAVIAGPCAVESREQTLAVARKVAAAGATMLRGGAYKPRTSPFAFQGLGARGLEILAEARAETGLPIVTELLDVRDGPLVAEHADVIQIGARNMQNSSLLEAAAELGRPLLLKRGMSATAEELLMAADYVLNTGNEDVVLCERGIRTFENATRATLDPSIVAWLQLRSSLPVIVDPSHAAGDAALVGPSARAAAAVGADGVIVEVHDDPEAALCDGRQAVPADDFAELVEAVATHARAEGRAIA